MCSERFSTIVANNFVEIKKNFKTGLKNSGYKWDEDIFMDAYVKCDGVLKDRLIDKKEALRYYWTAYINKMKNKYKSRYSVMDEIPEDYDKIDEEYNEDKDLLCDELYKSVKNKFGEEYDIFNKPKWGSSIFSISNSLTLFIELKAISVPTKYEGTTVLLPSKTPMVSQLKSSFSCGA